MFLLRFDELAGVVHYDDTLGLETCLVAVNAIGLLTLAAFDGYTIYKEVSEGRNPRKRI